MAKQTKTPPVPVITQDGPAPDGGSVNDKPPGWREITAKELAKGYYATYYPDRTEHRSIVLPHVDRDGSTREMYSSVTLYWYFDGSGVAIECVHWGVEANKPEDERTYMRFYAFELCKHEYVELSPATARRKGIEHCGMCWHVLECARCGHVWSYDSSD
jgi:hypothetical protein